MRYFVAVAEELSFSRAAERLGIAQPPLSQQIMSLEEEVGARLLERTKRSVSLTTAGRFFLESAYRTLRDAQQAAEAARRATDALSGRISVGFVASASFTFLPSLIRDFRAAQPTAEIELRDMSSAEQEVCLSRGELDLGFARPPLSLPGLQSTTVSRERFVVAVEVDHPLASEARVRPSSLDGESFIAFDPSLAPGLRRRIDAILEREGARPKVVKEVGQLGIALAFVAAGLGASILPSSIQSFSHEHVAFRPLWGVDDEAEIVVAWKQGASPLAREFVRFTNSRGVSQR